MPHRTAGSTPLGPVCPRYVVESREVYAPTVSTAVVGLVLVHHSALNQHGFDQSRVSVARIEGPLPKLQRI